MLSLPSSGVTDILDAVDVMMLLAVDVRDDASLLSGFSVVGLALQMPPSAEHWASQLVWHSRGSEVV